MPFELKEGNGGLFANQNKKTPNHPDWAGEIKLSGKLYWLNGWSKKDKNGNDYISVSLGNEKVAKAPMTPSSPRQSFPPKREPEDGEIPFSPCL